MSDSSLNHEPAPEPSLEERRLAIEQRKLLLEERKSVFEMDLRKLELEIKNRESGWASKFFSPLTTTLLAGVLTLAGSVVGTLLQGRQTLQLEEQKFKTTRSLEEEKFGFSKQIEIQKQQHDLIVKMISVADEKQARDNIKFLADIGLISDPELTKRLLAAPTVGVLPPPNTAPTQPRLPAPSIAGLSGSAARAQRLYERPALTFDPGTHIASINSIDVDAAGNFAVTGSDDKTVRIWSIADGKLLRTMYVPQGPGDVGKIYAVAVSPDGNLVAAGGWSGWVTQIPEASIYLFDGVTGKMTARIPGLPDVIHRLVFSPDGRYLAAGVSGKNGLRIYDRDRQWAESFRDTGYDAVVYGIAFSDDGRLATASYDGKVRLYDRNFKLTSGPKGTTIGKRPFAIAFSPGGNALALGFDDVPKLNVLDGHTLAPLPAPNTDGMTEGSLAIVGWSKDGQILYAGGNSSDVGSQLLVAWANSGHGNRHELSADNNRITGLSALPDGGLLVATQDPVLKLLKPDGSVGWVREFRTADFRAQSNILAVSADGSIVDFGFGPGGKSPVRFDLRALRLSRKPPADRLTTPPKQVGLAIEHLINSEHPTLDGKPIELYPYEISRSFAIHPDGGRFVIGASLSIQAIDTNRQRIWRKDAPSAVWAVNITGDGRLVVAAYGDGTIRWHSMDDGRELLAFRALPDSFNWVAWTPEGFFGATPGAFGVLLWEINHGFDAAGETVPLTAIPNLRRPDVLPLILQELETARALGIAETVVARREARSAPVPRARLHVLAVGVNDYGDKAKDLKLRFAVNDAQGVASALVNTQEGSLYSEVLPMYLHDRTADKAGIFDALAAIERNMGGSNGQDLAVVLFSGQGTAVENKYYLFPYGVDNSSKTRLVASAIAASDLQHEVQRLAERGRVLLLFDACSGRNCDQLRATVASNNVTVLTSSTGDELSRESEVWQHGALTKVLLDALSSSAHDVDTDHNGVISMSELAGYVAKNLPILTAGQQRLGLDQRFEGDIFIAGL